jgi:hypothetical protein
MKKKFGSDGCLHSDMSQECQETGYEVAHATKYVKALKQLHKHHYKRNNKFEDEGNLGFSSRYLE